MTDDGQYSSDTSIVVDSVTSGFAPVAWRHRL